MAYSPTQLQVTHVLQQFYRRMGGKITLATGGSTTTFIDTNLATELAEDNVDDIYNGGTFIVIKDAAGLFAAPEGEFSRFTDYVASTTTGTFSPALTTAVASGDKILLATPDFPLYDMLEVVNDALRNIGDIPVVDSTLTTAANKTEYALPLALKGLELLNIELQGILTDANDNRYVPITNYKIVEATGGSTGLLVLPQFAAGYTIRITYLGRHPRVEAFADYINEHLHPELVKAAVFAHALQWRNSNDAISGGGDEAKQRLEQQAWSEYDRARVTHRVEIPPKRFQGFPAWGTTSTFDEFVRPPQP